MENVEYCLNYCRQIFKQIEELSVECLHLETRKTELIAEGILKEDGAVEICKRLIELREKHRNLKERSIEATKRLERSLDLVSKLNVESAEIERILGIFEENLKEFKALPNEENQSKSRLNSLQTDFYEIIENVEKWQELEKLLQQNSIRLSASNLEKSLSINDRVEKIRKEMKNWIGNVCFLYFCIYE